MGILCMEQLWNQAMSVLLKYVFNSFFIAVGEYEDLRAANNKKKEEVCTLQYVSLTPNVLDIGSLCLSTDFS